MSELEESAQIEENTDNSGGNDESQPKKELSPIEKEAAEDGWKPKEEFEGDPEKWTSAREFVRYGKLMKTMNNMKNDFDVRIRDVNAYHEMQKAAEINELKSQQRRAVRSGDEEAFDIIQQRIDGFERSKQVSSKDPAVADWESRNPWINNHEDPKTIEANAFYIGVKKSNPTISEKDALAYVDERLGKLYQQTNPLRSVQTRAETGGQRVTNATKGAVSWGDLTQSELKDWKNFGETMFKDQKTFLKAVSDARKK
jgi:hypothetical protein